LQTGSTKTWVRGLYGGIVAVVALITCLALLGVDLVVQVVVVGIYVVAFGIVWDDKRSWWGAGPTQFLSRPDARRRVIRNSAIVAVAAISVGMVIGFTLAYTGVVGG
jgi:ABC-type Fe3+ transport system permease subunit